MINKPSAQDRIKNFFGYFLDLVTGTETGIAALIIFFGAILIFGVMHASAMSNCNRGQGCRISRTPEAFVECKQVCRDLRSEMGLRTFTSFYMNGTRPRVYR